MNMDPLQETHTERPGGIANQELRGEDPGFFWLGESESLRQRRGDISRGMIKQVRLRKARVTFGSIFHKMHTEET